MHVGPHGRKPVHLLLDVALIDPANEPGDDAYQQQVNQRLGEPPSALGGRLCFPACREIFAIRRVDVGGKIGARAKPLRRFQPSPRVGEPGGGLAVRSPIAGCALDAVHDAQKTGILRQPALQHAPLPQQCFMRRLDRLLARVCLVFGDVGGKQTLLDEMLDKGPGLRGNSRKAARRGGAGRRCRDRYRQATG